MGDTWKEGDEEMRSGSIKSHREQANMRITLGGGGGGLRVNWTPKGAGSHSG